MISDNYMDTTSEMLNELGYEPGFMEDLQGGEEIVIMEKNFANGESDVITFLSILPGSVRRDPYTDSPGCVVRFIVRTEKGATKPMSYGGVWGIYIKKSV